MTDATGRRRRTIKMHVARIAFVKRGANGKTFALYKGAADEVPAELAKFCADELDVTAYFRAICESLNRAAR